MSEEKLPAFMDKSKIPDPHPRVQKEVLNSLYAELGAKLFSMRAQYNILKNTGGSPEELEMVRRTGEMLQERIQHLSKMMAS